MSLHFIRYKTDIGYFCYHNKGTYHFKTLIVFAGKVQKPFYLEVEANYGKTK